MAETALVGIQAQGSYQEQPLDANQAQRLQQNRTNALQEADLTQVTDLEPLENLLFPPQYQMRKQPVEPTAEISPVQTHRAKRN